MQVWTWLAYLLKEIVIYYYYLEIFKSYPQYASMQLKLLTLTLLRKNNSDLIVSDYKMITTPQVSKAELAQVGTFFPHGFLP